jgi:hypothetical protein
MNSHATSFSIRSTYNKIQNSFNIFAYSPLLILNWSTHGLLVHISLVWEYFLNDLINFQAQFTVLSIKASVFQSFNRIEIFWQLALWTADNYITSRAIWSLENWSSNFIDFMEIREEHFGVAFEGHASLYCIKLTNLVVLGLETLFLILGIKIN